MPPMVAISKDFKMARFGEWLHNTKGQLVRVVLCQELIGGRWESFITIQETR